MVNGAGLAMATMDIIKLSAATRPSMWGGTADAKGETAFKIILKDPRSRPYWSIYSVALFAATV